MTNPTLERAARAAYDHPASFSQGCWVDPPEHLDLASVVVDGDVNLIEIARAVLMAVREPELNDGGGDIYRAGFEAMFDAKFKDEYPMMSTGWEAMIDAILNDGEGK